MFKLVTFFPFKGLQSGMRRQQSDTLSSDVIVNSISKGEFNSVCRLVPISCFINYMPLFEYPPPPPPPTELDTYEKQLALVKEELTRYKKAARLWKSRYEQERRARYDRVVTV